METIDTTNRFLVGARGDSVIIMRRPNAELSKEDALNLAAWLVALADPDGEEFKAVRGLPRFAQ